MQNNEIENSDVTFFSILLMSFSTLFCGKEHWVIVSFFLCTLMVLAGIATSNWYKKHYTSEKNTKDYKSLQFFLYPSIEEIVCRWFVFSVIAKEVNFFWITLSYLAGIFLFKRPLNTIKGLSLIYVYLEYGIMASLLLNLFFDAFVYSIDKVENLMPDKDIFSIGYLSIAFAALIGFNLFYYKFSLLDYNVSSTSLVFCSLAYVVLIQIMGILFCFDQGIVQPDGKCYDCPSLKEVLLGSGLLALIGVGISQVLIFTKASVEMNALVGAMCLCSISPSFSGSNLARMFFIRLPVFFVSFYVGQMVSFIEFIVYLTLLSLIFIPKMILDRGHPEWSMD